MDEVLRPDDRVRIVGTVKNLIFQNQENGYTVLRLDVGGDDPSSWWDACPLPPPGRG